MQKKKKEIPVINISPEEAVKAVEGLLRVMPRPTSPEFEDEEKEKQPH